jgi:hypothetical protein
LCCDRKDERTGTRSRWYESSRFALSSCACVGVADRPLVHSWRLRFLLLHNQRRLLGQRRSCRQCDRCDVGFGVRCLRGGRGAACGKTTHQRHRLDSGCHRTHGVDLQRRWRLRHVRDGHPGPARRPRRLRRVGRKLLLVPDARVGPRLPAHALPRRAVALPSLASGRSARGDRDAGYRPPQGAHGHPSRKRSSR